ncbi:ABATE domain-containing protein [Nonomuraea sp. NPDC052265]|uniref:ABATE domain-containing protein n=1 Tax=Nonomuraea sp. NPDC052265 TaxID=3364374 RepID=UPI0037C531B4
MTAAPGISGTASRHAASRATPADLARWTVAAGLLDEPPETGDDDLARVAALREALYRLATAAREGSPYGRADRDLINEPPGTRPRTSCSASAACGAAAA